MHYRFPSLFGEIENDIFNGGDLGIDSYGTSMPTLEEVFLRLGDEDDDDENKMVEELKSKQNGILKFDAILIKQGFKKLINIYLAVI